MKQDFSPLTAPLYRWCTRRAQSLGVTLPENFRLGLDTLLAFWMRAEAAGSVCINLADAHMPLVGFVPMEEGDDDVINDNAPEAIAIERPRYVFEDDEAVNRFLSLLTTLGVVTSDVPTSPLTLGVPFVLERTDTGLFLYRLRRWTEEAMLAKNLQKGLEARTKIADFTAEELEAILEKSPDFHLNAGQKTGILTAMRHAFSVISGGPGTGKTTSIVYLLASYLANVSDPLSIRVGLAAPTGKATARMKESIASALRSSNAALTDVGRLLETGGFLAQTLHKWLVSPTALGERPSATNPLSVDLFVVDEASMVDAKLADRIFSVIDFNRTTVILLGDKNQLAAVGPGSVFADLSDNDPEAPLRSVVTTLTESRRFTDASWVGQLARAVNDGNVPETLRLFEAAKVATFGEEAVHFTPTLGKPEALPFFLPVTLEDRQTSDFREYGFPTAAKRWMDQFLNAFEKALSELNDALKAKDTTQERLAQRGLFEVLATYRALCAQRRGALGVEALNRYAEARIKNFVTQTLGWRVTAPDTWPGRVVMVRQNDDELGVYNGDAAILVPSLSGRIVAILEPSGESPCTSLSPVLLPRVESAFAMTIHQSQGSEFKHVAVFMPLQPDSGLVTRELLYTGITRTKQTVWVFAPEDVLARAVTVRTDRTSGLQRRLASLACW